MLPRFVPTVIAISVVTIVNSEGQPEKPYVLPIPFELPNRNDRAEQCWLRIEDAQFLETISVYCSIAHEFLRWHVPEFNSRMMTVDEVDVSLWSDEPGVLELQQRPPPEPGARLVVDWKEVTVLDPITHMRIYVPKSAACKLVIINREAASNYLVNCDKVLYYVNSQMQGDAVWPRAQLSVIGAALVFLMCVF